MNDLKKESLEFIDTIHAIRIFIQVLERLFTL